mgnify:CR=1 FL=1
MLRIRLRLRGGGLKARVAVAPRRRVATSKGPWRLRAVTSCIARKAAAPWLSCVYTLNLPCLRAARQGRCQPLPRLLWGCRDQAPSRSSASMSDPWGNPSTSPLPRGHQKPHGGIGAIAPADGYSSCQPTPSRTGAPSSRACRSCGTGEQYAGQGHGGDIFFEADRPPGTAPAVHVPARVCNSQSERGRRVASA